MHVLAIDIGTYSVKYISSFVDRKKVSHVDMSEIIVSDFMADHPELTKEEGFASIIQEIIDTIGHSDSKVIYQIDHQKVTTRFLSLPVKNKKKAELMLPFQLEEDIPYPLSEIHYAYHLEAEKNQHYSLIELITNEEFGPYYDMYRDSEILPQILTTETSVIENYFHSFPYEETYCVLDIGHSTTKAYFFLGPKLLMSHISYMGGVHINEMISRTYNIDQDEAIIYKHQNAFLLTSHQYSEVETTQREFASSMDKIFSQLIIDFSRWRVALRVNHALTLQQVYICGGTANIKNISNYLSEKWELKVSHLNTFDGVEASKLDLNPKNKDKFAVANMMSFGFKKKNRFINLLSGRFIQSSGAEIPLHSLAFIGVRVLALSLILTLSLMIEYFFLKKDIKSVNSKITTILKNSELNLPGRLRRQALNKPGPILQKLKSKKKEVKQEISTLQSAIQIAALAPLVSLSQMTASLKEVTLIEFESSAEGDISAIFEGKTIQNLNELKASLEASSFKEIKTSLDEAKLQLSFMAVRD